MNRLSSSALAAAIAFAVSACASVPMATAEQDLAAKEFRAPPADQAYVYVYRNEVIGAAVRQDVLVDGLQIGQTAAKVFFMIPVAPGQHTLASKSENTFELPVTVDGGQSYFVWQEVKMGFLMARTKLHLVDEATGKAGVTECKLGLPSALPPLPPSGPAGAPRS